jgi:hypothetical protein
MVDEYPNGLRTIWNNNIITSSFRDIQRACLKVSGWTGPLGSLGSLLLWILGPKFHPGTGVFGFLEYPDF